jgi:hypothetical protein
MSFTAKDATGVARTFASDSQTIDAVAQNVPAKVLAPTTDSDFGLSKYRNIDLDEAGQSVKASAGSLYGWYIFNAASSIRYVKLYDKASAPAVGTDTPVLTLPIPAGGGANVMNAIGIPFTLGIGAGATTGVADNNTGAPGANECIVHLFYK